MAHFTSRHSTVVEKTDLELITHCATDSVLTPAGRAEKGKSHHELRSSEKKSFIYFFFFLLLFLRDSRLLSIGGGADEVMLGIIAKYMDTLPRK